MTALLHAISIGTLATWLSVSALGTVGLMVPAWLSPPPKPALTAPAPEPEPFTLGAPEPSPGPSPAPSAEPPAAAPDSSTPELPTPPELPRLATFEPLPEIPPLPAPRPSAFTSPVPSPVIPATATAKPSTRSSSAARQTSTARNTSASSAGTGTSSTGTSSALSDTARLAAGTMTPPSYPSYCRSHNQTGTVIVEFTVDTSGKVISAYTKSSSNWPLLDNEAVRTVRRWKFPPGGVMRLQRPIVFKLS